MTARMVEILRKPLSILIKYWKFGKKLILNEREAIIRCHHTECSVEARGRKKTTSMANQGQGGTVCIYILSFIFFCER
jgi:hypothetical protein